MNEVSHLVIIFLTVVAFAVAVPVALVAWVRIIKNSLMTIRCVKAGVKLWGMETMFNPFNVLLRPSLLTDEGLKYRREVGKNVLLFVSPLLLLYFLASVGGFLK